MINGSRTELSIELLGSELFEIIDDERPQVKHIVARKLITLLDYHNLRGRGTSVKT